MKYGIRGTRWTFQVDNGSNNKMTNILNSRSHAHTSPGETLPNDQTQININSFIRISVVLSLCLVHSVDNLKWCKNAI